MITTVRTEHTTRAVVQDRYGPPKVLTLAEVPRPAPGPGQVLVRIEAAALNARDWHVMRGEPRPARLVDRSTFGLRRPGAAVRGTDLAGIVEAVGQDVTRWKCPVTSSTFLTSSDSSPAPPSR